MTREEIKDAAKVMEAYANGKKIQFLDEYNKWIDVTNPSFNWSIYIYRIKPEPKYRPFESLEECWQEMLKHQPFGWLMEKVNKKEMVHIGRIYDIPDNAFITLSIDEGHNYSSGHFFRTYTFADGTPFGVKLELL